MDTISAAAVARRFETSIPRVKRAMTRAGLGAAVGRGGRVTLTADQVDRLSTELPKRPSVAGLSPVQTRVLAALAHAPLGLRSVRAVASRAGVSPTSAGRALGELMRLGWARRDHEMIAEGRAHQIRMIRLDRRRLDFGQVMAGLARVPLPARNDQPSPAGRVPARLSHLFWNTAPSQLDVATSADYIARRLISVGDAQGLAWGLDHLPANAWLHAARTRGLGRQARQMALAFARVDS